MRSEIQASPVAQPWRGLNHVDKALALFWREDRIGVGNEGRKGQRQTGESEWRNLAIGERFAATPIYYEGLADLWQLQ
jgi:hypothetical protein